MPPHHAPCAAYYIEGLFGDNGRTPMVSQHMSDQAKCKEMVSEIAMRMKKKKTFAPVQIAPVQPLAPGAPRPMFNTQTGERIHYPV